MKVRANENKGKGQLGLGARSHGVVGRGVWYCSSVGLFSYERDDGGFHYFSKIYGLFMANEREILIALSLATKAGCYQIPQLLKRVRVMSYAEVSSIWRG
nr:hypothetical protein [Tanacetum cinerariifolium]